MMQNLTGNMFTYAYYVDERAEERNTIRVYGLDEENNSVCVTIDDLRHRTSDRSQIHMDEARRRKTAWQIHQRKDGKTTTDRPHLCAPEKVVLGANAIRWIAQSVSHLVLQIFVQKTHVQTQNHSVSTDRRLQASQETAIETSPSQRRRNSPARQLPKHAYCWMGKVRGKIDQTS
jgi:hypothetical protein